MVQKEVESAASEKNHRQTGNHRQVAQTKTGRERDDPHDCGESWE